MGGFSERMGYISPPTDLAQDAMSDRLRNQIWNVLRGTVFSEILQYASDNKYFPSNHFSFVARSIWGNHLGEDVDALPESADAILTRLKSKYTGFEFYELYDFLEFILSVFNVSGVAQFVNERDFRNALNRVLESNRAAFRVVDRQILPITNEAERSEVEQAMQQSRFASAREHLKAAASLYSDESPDYRNSVKESISAVESAIAEMTGEKSPNSARPFKELKDKYNLHPALADGMSKYFAWTSDDGGIRHALMEGSREITQADARLMLISCSAFVNYLVTLPQ